MLRRALQADQGEYGIPGLGVRGRGPYFSP